jgi:hypothetical protein
LLTDDELARDFAEDFGEDFAEDHVPSEDDGGNRCEGSEDSPDEDSPDDPASTPEEPPEASLR